MKNTILRVDASMRHQGSVSRELANTLLQKLADLSATDIIERDLTDSIPYVNEDWINANFTDPEQRNAEQKASLALSDRLVEELQNADTLVIATPIYNFGVPAALKAWVDMIARARLTFRYTENGPVGLLEDKKAYVVVTSGGTELGTDIDFVTAWMSHVLGFIGIHDVTFINASGLMKDQDGAIARAEQQIQSI